MPLAVIISFALLTLTFSKAAQSAPVEDTYVTMMPSANDSSFYRDDPDPTDPTNSYAAEVAEDIYLESLYYEDDSNYFVMCHNFSNASGPYWGDDYATMPEEAEVVSVWVYAHFTYHRPAMSLRITANGSTTSTYVSAGVGGYTWNVTSLRDWDHDMLFNVSTYVSIYTFCTGGVNYLLGYLGYWYIQWYGWYDEDEYEGEDPEDGEGTDYEFEYDWIYSAEGMIGALGMMGLIGMVGTPALGVWLIRNSDEGRMNICIKMLAMFMVFLTFFMISVSG